MPRARKYTNNAQRQAAYRQRLLNRQATVLGHAGRRRWNRQIEEALLMLEGLLGEMRAYYDERSEGWQSSERGETFMETADTIEEITQGLRDLI